MIHKGELDENDCMQIECLWFSFIRVIQSELNEVKDN